MPGDAVDARLVEVLECVLRAADITEADEASVGTHGCACARAAAAEDQVFEGLHRLEVAVHHDRHGGVSSLGRRWSADAAPDDDLVLRLQRVNHIEHGEVEARQLLGIDPEAIGRVAGTKDIHLAHPLSAAQGIGEIQLVETIEVIGIKLTFA